VAFSVIPAKAGIQKKQALLDPGFRRGDGFGRFLRLHQNSGVFDFNLMKRTEALWGPQSDTLPNRKTSITWT
jgi:hypothetical protein